MGLMSAAMILGNALSFFLTGYIFSEAQSEAEIKEALHTVLICQSCIVGFTFLFFQATIREKPLHPPSAVAIAPVSDQTLLVGLKEIFNNRSLLLLTIAFASFIGLYFSLGNIMSSLFHPIGFGPMEISSIGLTMLSSGVVGAAFTGWILDKTAAYRKLLLFLTLFTGISFGLISFEVFHAQKLSTILMYMTMLGSSMISVLPTSLGLGVELTFPMQPALVNGGMLVFVQLSGCLQSVFYSTLMDTDPSYYDSEEALNAARTRKLKSIMIIFGFISLLSFTLVCFVKEDLKRLRFNQGGAQGQQQVESKSAAVDDDFKRTVN